MNHNNVKEQLMSRVDEIANAIINDKVVEIKKERDNVQIFEIKRKKLIKIKK